MCVITNTFLNIRQQVGERIKLKMHRESIVKNRKITVLLYADDILIITDNLIFLKKGLKIATQFGNKWRCKYNAKKTQVVIFGKKTKKNITGKSATKQLNK